MARQVANVEITQDTWETAIQRENVLLDALSNEIITANSSFANTGTPGAQRNAHLYGQFVANTITVATALRGGSNTSTPSNLNITSNTIITGASVNVASNTTITGIVNTTANVTMTGTRLNVIGTLANVAANVIITGNNQQFKSNSSITAIAISGNSSATNTAIAGSLLTILTTNTTVTGTVLTISSNTTVTAAEQQFKSNSSITAISISGNSSATNTAIGGTQFNVVPNTAITGSLSVANVASIGGTTTLMADYVIDVYANNDIGTTFSDRMVYTFPKATYRTGKLMIQASRTGNNQIAELVVAHDNTNAFVTMFGVVSSPQSGNTSAILGTYSALINNANVEIYMTQTANNTSVKVVAHLIK